MNEKELIERIQDRWPGLSLRTATFSVQVLLQALTQALAAGRTIELRGLGVFQVVQRAPRAARNPRTGAKVQVPTRRAVKFRPAFAMRTLTLAADAASVAPAVQIERDAVQVGVARHLKLDTAPDALDFLRQYAAIRLAA